MFQRAPNKLWLAEKRLPSVTPELSGAGPLTSSMELKRHPGVLCSDLVRPISHELCSAGA